MILFYALLAAAVGMTVAQDLWVGQPLYHFGWYNVLDGALFVLALLRRRALTRRNSSTASRSALLLFGCGIVVLAGVASGLMGTNTHAVIGAPGATVYDPSTATSFVFPLRAQGAIRMPAGFDAGNSRYSGGLVLTRFLRPVVMVAAADDHGNSLTLTQPSNASFLSPVLLMQQKTVIAGMPVRFDTFSIPAKRRSVKAVLFSVREASQLRTEPPIEGRPAVLFDVIPGGIGIAASGASVAIAGLRLTARVQRYPAVRVASAPYLPVLLAGLLIGIAGAIRMRSRSKT